MKKIKKIAFLGNFSVDYCTEVHHAKTYEKLGIEVVRMQEGKWGSDSILNVARECDAFCWTHTHGWKTEGIEEVLRKLKELGIPSYGYHLDLWLGIEREKDLKSDPFWKVDHFFSVDMEMVNLLNSSENMPKGHFLPAGVFEDECYIAEPNREKYPHDIIFVGSRGYHLEWPYRKELIDWLEKSYGNRFAQYGGGGLGTIRGHELNMLYASAKIVVGDTLCPNFNKPWYLSDRIFETTGRGGFIIHPYIEGIQKLFKTNWDVIPVGIEESLMDAEIVVYSFRGFEQLKAEIDYYLGNEKVRESIRINGHERAKRDHTYTSRLKELINVLENE